MTILNSTATRDMAHQLHPYTNAVRHDTVGPIVIERGEGVYVFDDKGNRYLEGLAGLWSVAVGFGEKRLVNAATEQMNKLPYYHIFSHKSHEPSIALAEKLAELAPGDLNRVFFTNSGSEANDTVVKLLWYYNNAVGRPKKKKFLARTLAYHGITVAAGSLTGLPNNHRDFDLPAIPVRHLTCPHFYRFGTEGETETQFVDRLIVELEDVIAEEGAETIAGLIGEPLMSAGGVMPAPQGYWKRVEEVCRRNDIMLIADEVITGFGRLGTMFGCQYYGFQPDILVLSKQITSSYQPLAAVVMSEKIYSAVAENTGKIGTFGHGYTGSGHPVATAVALENIAIIEEKNLVENAAGMGEILRSRLLEFSGHQLIGEIRGAGLIAAVEFVADKVTKAKFDPPGQLGAYVFHRAHHHGLILRAIGDVVAFCPPLIITESQIDELITAFGKTLEDASRWVADGKPAF